MIGESIGNYRVTGKIGAGGMGTVYLAEHQLIGRKAALKMLLPDLSNSKRQVQRFFNEAKAASAIRHPGIVEIFDFGFHNGQAFILMEFLEGESLQTRLRRNKVLTQHAALHLLRQVSSCLAAAHEQGIIHRDLKPDNIFIVADPEVSGGERVKLLDFGIAKLSGDQSNDMKTRTGTVMGTPAYMSPEQCRGAERVDARSDLYSLGCILYRMLCGQPPFVSKYSGDILAMQIMYDPPEPRALVPDLPAPIAAFIMRLLSKDSAMRPQSARALMDELDQLGHVTRTSGMHGRMPTSHEYPSQPGQPPPLTTLAGSAGVVAGTPAATEPTRRSRAPLIAGLVAVVVVAVVALFAAGVFSGPSDEPSAAAPIPIVESPTDSGDKVRDSSAHEHAEASGAADDADGSGSDDSPSADKRVITVASEPSGATVKRGDEELGVTPLKLDEPAQERVTLTVSLDGYGDQTVELPADADKDGRVSIAMRETPTEPESGSSDEPERVSDSGQKSTRKASRRSRRKSGKSKTGKKKSGKKKNWQRAR